MIIICYAESVENDAKPRLLRLITHEFSSLKAAVVFNNASYNILRCCQNNKSFIVQRKLWSIYYTYFEIIR